MARRQLPAASLHVLLALLEGEKHGYAVMRDVERLSGGAVKMGPGTLYGTIKRLLADRLVEEVASASGGLEEDDRRRFYRLTATGEQVAAAEVARLRTLLKQVRRLRPDLGGGIA